MNSRRELFNVKPHEVGLVLALGFILFSNSLAQQISGIVAISGFLGQVGVPGILIVWSVDVILIALTSGVQSLLVDRFNRLKLIRVLTLAFAVIFVIIRLMFMLPVPAWLNYSLLYLISEQQWLFFPIVFWILANDGLSTSQTKRLFPIIASFAFIGKLIGIGIALFSPLALSRLGLSLEDVLAINVIVYCLAFVVSLSGLHKLEIRSTVARKQEKLREVVSEGLVFMREVPAFRLLGVAIVAVFVADTIIEYHFLAVSDQVFDTQERYQIFYSTYQLVLTLAAVAVQGLLTTRLITNMGLKNIFFIWPAAALASGIWMLAMPGIISAVGGVILEKLPQSTVDESARKSLESLVPDGIRGRVSIFMDSYLFAAGTLIACVLTACIVFAGGSFYLYLSFAVLAACISILAVYKMRQQYDTSLLHWRLKRRRSRVTLVGKLVSDLMAEE
jgi:ATP/ADP translocase